MARRFRRAMGRRPRAPMHWHREAFADLIPVATNTDVTLLEVGDYNANAALSPSGVTLIRTIVDVTLNSIGDASAATPSIVEWMLWVADRDQATINPATSQNLIDERVLDHGSVGIWFPDSNQTTGVNAPFVMPHWRLDTKQRVRLHDQEVRLTFRSVAGAAPITAFVHTSLLLRGDMT